MLRFLDEFFGYGKKKKSRWAKIDLPDTPSKCDDKDDHAITPSNFNPSKENLKKLADVSEAAYQAHLVEDENKSTLRPHAFSLTRLSTGETILGLICFVYMLYRIFG